MHAVVGTRGIKWFVDNFFNQLQGQYLPFDVKSDRDAKTLNLPSKGMWHTQVQVRPIQVWDIVFPKEHKDVMLNTLFDLKGQPMNSKHQKYITMLAKAMGLKKIPDYDTTHHLAVKSARQHTEYTAIGIKDDGEFEDGTEAL